MRINWGTKLVFFTLIFMAFIVTLVVIISRQDVPLVEQNYYEKGLEYQHQIDNSQRVDSLFSVLVSPDGLEVMPLETRLQGKYTVFFYRPSDPAMDKEFEDQPVSGKKAVYDLGQLASGKWKVGIYWDEEGKSYRIERELDRP